MEFAANISMPAVALVLVAMVNVLTEVTKKVWDVRKAEHVVVTWAVVLSVPAAIGLAALQGMTAWWMLLLAAAAGCLLGGLVAYAAMFGYDELYYQVLELLGGFVTYLNQGEHGNERESQ